MKIYPASICKILLCGCIALIWIGQNQGNAQVKKQAAKPMLALETGFNHIPDSIQTSVYWYWMSDNISKEGVIRDLEAMKKVGINRAFIGNIGGQKVPYGKVKLFSDEWWDIMHAALKTATRLNIEIGIFNSPGWSQSGGPWVKPEQAMRYLTSSQTMVTGPAVVNKMLPKPIKEFQDVKVIAYPVGNDYNTDISSLHPKLKTDAEIPGIDQVMDHNMKSGVEITKNKPFTLDIQSSENYTVRSLVIYPLNAALQLTGNVQVENNGVFETIKHFSVDHSKPSLNVGFKPFGPAAISIPETSAKNFRIVFTNVPIDTKIAEIQLSGTPVVEDYIGKTLAKMWQTPYPYWDAYQWGEQPVIKDNMGVIDPARVLDLTKFMSADGTLKWNAPAGTWIIERSGMTPTGITNGPASPEGTGLETDKMSKTHIEAHFNAFLGQIIKHIPAADRKTWKVTVADSYEMGGQNWSDGLMENFKLRYGYDPTPYLPVMEGKVVGSEDQSDRFLWDLRRFVADNVAYQYVGGLRDISHKYGLHTWLESYGHWGFPGEFLQYGGQSDEVAGEFWSFGALGNIENRDASSTAHIYGKTKVSAESFTGADSAFSRYPAMLKQRVDRFFTEGINNTLLHLYIQQPYEDKYPGVNAPFGNEFNRHNAWFYDMDIFLQYLKRSNLMLQQGKYVADAAYFISEDAPKMTGTQDPALPKGYSFDYINAEVIKTRLSVKNGKLMLPDGMQYSVLILPNLETMRPELLQKIKELVIQGAVVIGPKPSRSPSLQNFAEADKQVQALAAQLWGNINGASVKVNRMGKGMVIGGMDLHQAFDLLKVKPDFTGGGDSTLFIHRVLKDGDIYFISNQKNIPIKFKANFRIAAKAPELWDAVSGSQRYLPAFTQSENGTTVPMELGPLESSFIVFRKKGTAQAASKANYPLPLKTIDISGDWMVRFDYKMRGPKLPVLFKTLTDWTTNASDSIKYYSGPAIYTNTFNAEVKKGETVLLDLGAVSAIAKVKVNGVEVGGAWVYPFTVDVTGALKPGLNRLEIKVTNTWVNRLIGDAKLPPSERKTWTVINPYTATSKLLPSGLVGPVRLQVIKY
jgi:hypothetical protein